MKKDTFNITFYNNIKRGFKNIVDMLMFLLIVIVAIIDLFYDINIKGGYGFFAFYIFWLIYRIGFFKNALDAYVTRADLRHKLKLPNTRK